MGEIEMQLVTDEIRFSFVTKNELQLLRTAPKMPAETLAHHASPSDVSIAMHWKSEGCRPNALVLTKPAMGEVDRQRVLIIEDEACDFDFVVSEGKHQKKKSIED